MCKICLNIISFCNKTKIAIDLLYQYGQGTETKLTIHLVINPLKISLFCDIAGRSVFEHRLSIDISNENSYLGRDSHAVTNTDEVLK